VASTAARLIAELQAPMRLAKHTLVVTPSIGVSLYPSDGEDVDTLLRNADLAMYIAKRKGPGLYEFFDSAMNDAALHRFTVEAQLRGAVARGELALHYQPQFDVSKVPCRAWRRCFVGRTTSSVPSLRPISSRLPKKPD